MRKTVVLLMLAVSLLASGVLALAGEENALHLSKKGKPKQNLHLI